MGDGESGVSNWIVVCSVSTPQADGSELGRMIFYGPFEEDEARAYAATVGGAAVQMTAPVFV